MHRTTLPSVVFVVAFAGSLLAQQQQQQPQPAVARTMTVAAAPMSADALTGVWDYNAELSVDAATGRPEQAPRSAAARPVAPAGGGGTTAGRTGGGAPRPPTDPAGGTGGSGGGGGGARDGIDDARRAMAAVIAAERRTLLRDLLEIPETLTIRATPAVVTFIDDLKRERNYETDGKLRKYQISAARFEAKSGWQGAYFRKDIAGPNNFKMSETYFLSEDRRRLFVIIRIGDPKKPESLAGINRVFDRVDSTP